MLLTQKAYAEAARAFTYWAGLAIDFEHKHPDAGSAQGRRGPGRAADARRQGLHHRQRLRVHHAGDAGARRARLHRASRAWSSTCAMRAST